MFRNKGLQKRFELLKKLEFKTSNENVICQNPIVSVSVATYQHGNFIENCLNGILNQQTNFPFEIVIGEDESTDGTRDICIEYAKKHSDKIRLLLRDRKISCIHKKNGNLINSFNGIFTTKSCRGKYIALCEGDDYWTDPYKLQKQVDFLEANPSYSGCYHDTMVTYMNDDRPEHLFREQLPQFLNAEDTIALFAPFHTSSFLFKKESYTFEPFLLKVKSRDMALFSIVASKGMLGKVEGVMSVYRKHEGSTTNSIIHKKSFHKDRIELVKFLNRFHQFKYRDKAKQVIAVRRQIIREQRNNSMLLASIKKTLSVCKKVVEKSLKKMIPQK